MDNAELLRLNKGQLGVFGSLSYQGKKICVTCEDPDNGNAIGESCIPEGTYTVISHNSPKFPNTWQVTNVPGRSAILIHNGNTIDDTLGCILVGETYGNINGKPAVTNSVKTLAKLRTILPDTFTLTIKDVL